MRAPTLLLTAVLSLVTASKSTETTLQGGAGEPWSYNFLGTPSAPQTFVPPSSTSDTVGWDVLIHSSVPKEPEYDITNGEHSAMCYNSDPPPTHVITTFPETVFICNNHLMTSINDGNYGAGFLTPDRLIDLSGGQTVQINWSVSSYRSSFRDWWEVQISAFDDNLVGSVDPTESALDDDGCTTDSVDFFGMPARAVAVNANAELIVTGQDVPFCGTRFGFGWPPILSVVERPSSVRRDIFEIDLSQTHVTFGMWYQRTNPFPPYGPGDCPPDSGDYCWIAFHDHDLVPPLNWDTGILQLAHHSYNPHKDCDRCPECCDGSCYCATENTWHWSDIYISSARSFTITQSDARWVKNDPTQVITFDRPAPPNSYLRFEAISSDQVQYSLDGGATWGNAAWQPIPPTYDMSASWCHARSYWQPVPADTQSVMLRGTVGEGCGNPWIVRDITLWSP